MLFSSSSLRYDLEIVRTTSYRYYDKIQDRQVQKDHKDTNST